MSKPLLRPQLEQAGQGPVTVPAELPTHEAALGILHRPVLSGGIQAGKTGIDLSRPQQKEESGGKGRSPGLGPPNLL